jgi:Cu-processing system permease protein
VGAELALAAGIAVGSDLSLRLAGDATGGLLASLELMLILTPLLGLVLGTTRVHHARAEMTLLLAQPVSRTRLFATVWRQLNLPVAAAVVAGLALPLAWHGLFHASTLAIAVPLVVGITLLALASQGIALVIALRIDDRVRALLTALVTWLVLAVLWDGVALVVALLFADRPVEWPLLALLLLNPVDVVRVLLLLGSDAAALLGYTGAVVERVVGTLPGRAGLGLLLGAWVVLPAWWAARIFRRKDF